MIYIIGIKPCIFIGSESVCSAEKSMCCSLLVLEIDVDIWISCVNGDPM